MERDRLASPKRAAARAIPLAIAALAFACGSGSSGPSPVATPSAPATATPTPTPTPELRAELRILEHPMLAGFDGWGGPVLAPGGGAVAHTLSDAEAFEYVGPIGDPRTGYRYCYRAIAWRDGEAARPLGPDPGCPFPDPNPGDSWVGDSWPAALAGDGSIAVVNRVRATGPGQPWTFFFAFADADGGWEEIHWSVPHPDADRPPQVRANDVTPDGTTIVGAGWLERPFPGWDPSDSRPWLYRRGDPGPTWLPSATDVIETAIAVSDDGSTILGCCVHGEPDRALPVVWRGADAPVALPAPAGASDSCEALDLSGDGRVAVGRCGSAAVRWVDGDAEVIAFPVLGDDPVFEARAVSRDGTIALGGDLSHDDGGGGWLWSEATGARSVAELLAAGGGAIPPSTRIYRATAMSADGTVVIGFGERSMPGAYARFLYAATLPPLATALTPGASAD